MQIIWIGVNWIWVCYLGVWARCGLLLSRVSGRQLGEPIFEANMAWVEGHGGG